MRGNDVAKKGLPAKPAAANPKAAIAPKVSQGCHQAWRHARGHAIPHSVPSRV